MYYTLTVENDVMIPTRDGGTVCANVFRPAEAGEFPVIMTMGPYPKDIPFEVWNPVAWKHVPETGTYMHWETVNPEWWVPQGYVVIRCDSRGTGRSPGRARPLSVSEAEDFYDAVEWAGAQPWSNGKIGVMGISYFAMTTWPRSLQHIVGRRPLEFEAQSMEIDLASWIREGACVQGDGELEASQQLEALTMEERDRFDVTGNRSYVDVLHAEAARLVDGLLRKARTDAAIAMGGVNDDRLELGLVMLYEEAAEPDELAVLQDGDPDLRESRMGEVLIELDSGIGAANGGVAVDVPVALRQRAPQVAADIEVCGYVLADGHLAALRPAQRPLDGSAYEGCRRRERLKSSGSTQIVWKRATFIVRSSSACP